MCHLSGFSSNHIRMSHGSVAESLATPDKNVRFVAFYFSFRLAGRRPGRTCGLTKKKTPTVQFDAVANPDQLVIYFAMH